MTEQHKCWWVIRVELNGRIIAECNDPLCPGELDFLQISRRLNEYEKLKRATERLSAEDATLLAEDIQQLIEGYGNLKAMGCGAAQSKLQAYADILEPFTGGTVGAYFDTSRPEQEQDDETE